MFFCITTGIAEHPIGGIGRHDKVDFVYVDQFGVNAGNVGERALVVEGMQAAPAGQAPSLGVDLVSPNFEA